MPTAAAALPVAAVRLVVAAAARLRVRFLPWSSASSIHWQGVCDSV